MGSRASRHCSIHSFAAINSGRDSRVEGVSGFVLGVFKTGLDAAESWIARFRNLRAVSSIDGDMSDEAALGSSSLTSNGSSSVEIVLSFAS